MTFLTVSIYTHDSRTYKCGHCGKTFLDNSEFHRHSAMSHGDKIPDLVKDQEVTLDLSIRLIDSGMYQNFNNCRLRLHMRR